MSIELNGPDSASPKIPKPILALYKIKNGFANTRDLSDDQFYSLKSQEIKLLMIQWDRRPQTITEITGSSRSDFNKLLDPPPSIYAFTANTKQIFKQLSAWWKTGKTQQALLIENCDALPIETHLEFLENLVRVVKQQQILLYKLKPTTEIEFEALPDREEELSLADVSMDADGDGVRPMATRKYRKNRRIRRRAPQSTWHQQVQGTRFTSS